MQIAFPDEEVAKQAASAIELRLSSDGVAQVWTTIPKPRLTGVEIAAAVAVTVVVIRHTADAVQQLRRLLQEVRGLMGDFQAKGANVYVGDRRVAIDDLGDDDLKELIEPKS
jgi:hypothetical protein